VTTLHSFPTRRSSDLDVHVYPISTLTTSGLRELLFAIANMLDTIPKIPSLFSDVEDKVIYKHEKVETPFHITRASDGAYILSGEKIETLFKMTDFTSNESAQRFARQLRSLGIDKALRERGAQDGDIVRLLDFEFEFIE